MKKGGGQLVWVLHQKLFLQMWIISKSIVWHFCHFQLLIVGVCNPSNLSPLGPLPTSIWSLYPGQQIPEDNQFSPVRGTKLWKKVPFAPPPTNLYLGGSTAVKKLTSLQTDFLTKVFCYINFLGVSTGSVWGSQPWLQFCKEISDDRPSHHRNAQGVWDMCSWSNTLPAYTDTIILHGFIVLSQS